MMHHGYVVYSFRIHKFGSKEFLPLGALEGGEDALVLIYGALRGLQDRGVKEGNKYLHAGVIQPRGRMVRFKVDVGQSGSSSTFVDPEDEDRVVFRRSTHHVETSVRRCLLVAPTLSRTGLLVLEVHGRSGAKTILCPALKRAFRKHTGLIVDITAMVDEAALEHYLTQAALHEVTLRRTGLPSDIADAVDIGATESSAGSMELRISPGGIKRFASGLVAKLRGDQGARSRLLHVGGFEFSDLSVTMDVGDRRRTVTITADRLPNFVYDIPHHREITDEIFYGEVIASIDEIAEAAGVAVGTSWQDGEWSAEALATMLEIPAEEGTDDEASSPD
jgi:hypothetical protein